MTTRSRLAPEARRAQLIELGVRMLGTRTIDQLSIDDLAAAAGISRGLLFHYFRTKQDFHVAVAQAAADQLLAVTEPVGSNDAGGALRASLAAFVEHVTDNSEAYVALVRGAASADPALRAVSDATRARFAERVLDQAPALGLRRDAVLRLTVRAWVAFVEEAVVLWLDQPTMSRTRLVTLLEQSLLRLVAR